MYIIYKAIKEGKGLKERKRKEIRAARQLRKSLERSSLASLSPEALQTQSKAGGLLLPMAMPYHRITQIQCSAGP